MCVTDSVLTTSTSTGQYSPAVDPFVVHSNTKVERSSERVRPTVYKKKMTQSKSRSLDAAAVKQARLPVDDSGSVEVGRGKPLTADGKGDRQRLKQLAVDKVSHSF